MREPRIFVVGSGQERGRLAATAAVGKLFGTTGGDAGIPPLHARSGAVMFPRYEGSGFTWGRADRLRPNASCTAPAIIQTNPPAIRTAPRGSDHAPVPGDQAGNQAAVGELGRVVVVGTATVRVEWNVPAHAADLARKVADNPPIQREGQTVRLRPPSDAAEPRGVTVSYQVRVPPDTEVAAAGESGATTVRGVARAVVIRTQSGAIDVMQLGGTAVVTSGSGSITVDGVAGSLTVTTNSSRVENPSR